MFVSRVAMTSVDSPALTKAPFYWGALSSKEAEDALAPHARGAFLVRWSATSDAAIVSWVNGAIDARPPARALAGSLATLMSLVVRWPLAGALLAAATATATATVAAAAAALGRRPRRGESRHHRRRRRRPARLAGARSPPPCRATPLRRRASRGRRRCVRRSPVVAPARCLAVGDFVSSRRRSRTHARRAPRRARRAPTTTWSCLSPHTAKRCSARSCPTPPPPPRRRRCARAAAAASAAQQTTARFAASRVPSTPRPPATRRQYQARINAFVKAPEPLDDDRRALFDDDHRRKQLCQKPLSRASR